MIDKVSNLVKRHRTQIREGVLKEVDTIINLIQIDKLYLGSPFANLNKN